MGLRLRWGQRSVTLVVRRRAALASSVENKMYPIHTAATTSTVAPASNIQPMLTGANAVENTMNTVTIARMEPRWATP